MLDGIVMHIVYMLNKIGMPTPLRESDISTLPFLLDPNFKPIQFPTRINTGRNDLRQITPVCSSALMVIKPFKKLFEISSENA